MKYVLMLSFAGLALAGAAFGQGSNSTVEQWHKAKYGRYSAAEEARQKAETANTAFREDTGEASGLSNASSHPTVSWSEQWNKAKYGRYSAAEEARQRSEQSNTAYREESAPEEVIGGRPAETAISSWEQWHKAKYGRYSPLEEARQKAALRH